MAKKQTAKKYFLEVFQKMETALQEAKDLKAEADNKATTFSIQELMDVVKDPEVDGAAERVANLITDLAKNL